MEADDDAAGAVVDFAGVVRAREEEELIGGIEYEAHTEMAEHQIREVQKEAIQMHRLLAVTIWHRIGFVPAGEMSLFVRVRAAHRAAAFRGSSWIVDRLKERLPIWKHPRFSDQALAGTQPAGAAQE